MNYGIKSKFKTSFNYHQVKKFQISSFISARSGVGEIQGIIDPATKFLSIYRSVKLEQKASASKMQWWDRHRIDFPIPKGSKGKE